MKQSLLSVFCLILFALTSVAKGEFHWGQDKRVEPDVNISEILNQNNISLSVPDFLFGKKSFKVSDFPRGWSGKYLNSEKLSIEDHNLYVRKVLQLIESVKRVRKQFPGLSEETINLSYFAVEDPTYRFFSDMDLTSADFETPWRLDRKVALNLLMWKLTPKFGVIPNLIKRNKSKLNFHIAAKKGSSPAHFSTGRLGEILAPLVVRELHPRLGDNFIFGHTDPENRYTLEDATKFDGKYPIASRMRFIDPENVHKFEKRALSNRLERYFSGYDLVKDKGELQFSELGLVLDSFFQRLDGGKNSSLRARFLEWVSRNGSNLSIYRYVKAGYDDGSITPMLRLSLADLLDQFEKTLKGAERALFVKERMLHGLQSDSLLPAEAVVRAHYYDEGPSAYRGALKGKQEILINRPVPSKRTYPESMPSWLPEMDSGDDASERVKDVTEEHTYVTERGLGTYLSYFDDLGFEAQLKSANGESRWIDMGCGEACALSEYQSPVASGDESLKHYTDSRKTEVMAIRNKPSSQKAKTLGITVEIAQKNIPTFGGRQKIIVDYLENTTNEQFGGKADIITDLYGVLSYAPQIDEVLRRYTELLTDDGSIYANGRGTIVKKKDGSFVDFPDWIDGLKGLETYRLEADHKEYRIRKTGEPIHIPKLKLGFAAGDSPPYRVYIEQ